jgi:hypothetical protein
LVRRTLARPGFAAMLLAVRAVGVLDAHLDALGDVGSNALAR